MLDSLASHIDGKEVPASDGAVFAVVSPSSGEHLFDAAHATASDVDDAVRAARTAFDDRRWQGIPPRQRARILNRAAGLLAERIDEFARMETLQVGRPLREMRAQLRRLPEWLEYFGAVAQTSEGSVPGFGADHLNVVRRTPIGVGGLITPWNHPLLITMKKLSAAVAAGNSVVVKPSELGPAAPVMLARLLEEAGLPPGVVNVVTGLGASTGRFLSEHQGLNKLDITGGTDTGRIVAANAGRALIPITAELGGKAPVILCDDVDVDEAVAGALFASFIATGQTCVQGSRLLVHDEVLPRVLEGLVRRTEQLRLGDPLDADTQIGPLVSEAQRQKVADAVDRAREQGATVLCGGRVPDRADLRNGWFYEPTLVTDVALDSDLWREEVFGPVSLVMPFTDDEEAVRLANDAQFGLAASVWTNDVRRALRISDGLDIGITWINDHHRIDPASPWGGTKDSGIGSENGLAAFHSWTHARSVVFNAAKASDTFDWFSTTEELRYS